MNQRLQLPLGFLLCSGTLLVVAVIYAWQGDTIFSPGPLHEGRAPAGTVTRVVRGGVCSHAQLQNQCSACHAPAGSSERMETRCLNCHQEIQASIKKQNSLHGKMNNASECRNCHTEHLGPQATLTDFHQFDHDWTEFPLTGKHRGLDCAKCHHQQQYQTTAKSCVDCHAEPKVHLNKFGTNCRQCHSTETWKASQLDLKSLAGFNHDKTRFPLTGAHTQVACVSCHKTSQFIGTATSCVSCHAEPKVHLGKFGTNCSQCHSTKTWKGPQLDQKSLAGFDHNKTHFPLTGAHIKVACASCHKTSQFIGTATSCVSCHAEPKVHLGKFGTDCQSCHSTKTWQGATFANHHFPINHGGGRHDKACAVCHQSPDYRQYTCYGCHRHEPEKTEQKHRRIDLSVIPLGSCATCHPTGRKDKNKPPK